MPFYVQTRRHAPPQRRRPRTGQPGRHGPAAFGPRPSGRSGPPQRRYPPCAGGRAAVAGYPVPGGAGAAHRPLAAPGRPAHPPPAAGPAGQSFARRAAGEHRGAPVQYAAPVSGRPFGQRAGPDLPQLAALPGRCLRRRPQRCGPHLPPRRRQRQSHCLPEAGKERGHRRQYQRRPGHGRGRMADPSGPRRCAVPQRPV